MFNVHRRDVVRQQHHLVAVEFGRVFLLKPGWADLTHRPDDEIAGPYKRVNDVNAGIGEGSIEFGP